jgi:hypothetical protein
MNGFAATSKMESPLPMRMFETTKPGYETSDDEGQNVRLATVKTPNPVMNVALKPRRVKTQYPPRRGPNK